MKILVIYNTYRQPGGEDAVVDRERVLLEQHGHKVAVYKRSNHEIRALSLGGKASLISHIISAKDSELAVSDLLNDFKPDIVHVHNTFLMVSPSVYEACHRMGVPMVQTLHNYRLLCPASSFYRNGAICEECVTNGLLRSVRYGCYRESRTMSAAVALMLQTHRFRRTWHLIDAYIAISRFVRDKFVASGFPSAKIHVKPNFVGKDPGERGRPGDYALFVGRLSPEKGLAMLLAAWKLLPNPVPLVIAGDGPMRDQLESEVARRGLSNIRFFGRLDNDQVYDAMKKAAFLVVPSTWHEPFGLVVAEAFACGTPVLGANVGAIQSMLEEHETGLTFNPLDPDDLRQKVEWSWKHPDELAAMGKKCRRAYEERFTASANYDLLMSIYGSLIHQHAKSKRDRKSGAAA